MAKNYVWICFGFESDDYRSGWYLNFSNQIGSQKTYLNMADIHGLFFQVSPPALF